MPIVPAFCDTCGTAFNSGFFVENSQHITFSGNKSGPCPICGGMGHVPDGVFNFVGDTIEILSAPQRTISELLALGQIIGEARAKAENKAQVVARLEKDLPALSLLSKMLPENKNELYGFLGVILAAIALYTQSGDKPHTQTTINVTQVIETIIINEQQPPKAGVPNARPAKQGRNELCNCGSGSKYKKCCGAFR